MNKSNIIPHTNSVPNGTAPLTSKVHEYASQFLAYWKETAEGVIRTSLKFAEAKEKLDSVEFDEFLIIIGVDRKSSTYRKMMSIARAAPRLSQHLELLPSGWTTLYDLSKLKPEHFQRLIDKNILTPFVREFRQPPKD